MTVSTASAIAKGITRATSQGCKVLAWGTLKANGQRFALVSGSRGATYTVFIYAVHLTCTCAAHGMCKHRALVHTALAQAAHVAKVATPAAATRVAPAPAPRPAPRPAPITHETAPLLRDNRPISMWK